MLFDFLKAKPILDQESIEWQFACFAWALKNFDAKVFKQCQLVNPSNRHFPGRANSVEEMASMVFEKVVTFAGMQHWPFLLINEETLQSAPQQSTFSIEGPLRSLENHLPVVAGNYQPITITYHPLQINDPEVLIGSFAHALAHYLGTQAAEAPPGGQQNWPHVTELLAVFLGFGIIMANSAYTNKVRSCGSCAGPIVERMNFLSQHDLTYALAIFTTLKELPAKTVLPYLKKSLQPFYKRAVKDVAQNQPGLSDLKALLLI